MLTTTAPSRLPPTVTAHPTVPQHTRRWRGFYTAMSVLLLAAVVGGFWRTYFGPLLSGTLTLRPVVKVHAVVFTGWMILLVTQCALALVRRVDWHRQLGVLGVGYAILILATGILVTGEQFSVRMAAGDVRLAHNGLLFPIFDLTMFTGFFSAAILYRRKPEIHKRLIIVTSVILAGAGIGRLPFLTTIPQMATAAMAPFLLAMAFDLFARRRVHAVYLIGFATFLLSMVRVPLRESDAWFRFAMWLSELT